MACVGLSAGGETDDRSDPPALSDAAPPVDRAALHRDVTAALEADPTLDYSPTSLLIRFSEEATDDDRAFLRMVVNGRPIDSYRIVPGLEHMAVGGNLSVEDAIVLLSTMPGVEYVEPNYYVHACATPNDTYFGLQWGLHNTGQTINNDPGTADADIDAPEGWDLFTGDPDFVISIIDTGTQYSHLDLAANMWTNPGETAGNGIDDDGNGYVDDTRGWDFYNDDNNPDDSDGHGTHTAGTVGAVSNNGRGVAGVAWYCKLMPLRFIGPYGGSTSDAILAVEYAADKGVKISNNSWGGGGYSSSLYNAINASKSVGHIFVAAAGNNGSNNDTSPFYPASYNLDNIISVAATNNDDGLASFSNYGATTVDLGAPGVNIASTYKGGGYAWASGTSMAGPHVAGVTALVYAQNSGWTYSEVRARVFDTVRTVSALNGKCATGGVVNLAAALSASSNDPPTATISSPSDGQSFTQGASVQFTGSASDGEDGDLTASLSWTSSIDGAIGSGGSFSRSDLSVGTHTITASVTDSGGLSGSDTVTITINPQGPPAAPSSPTATNLGGGQARITWVDNSDNEDNFQIEHHARINNTWTFVKYISVGANETSYTDTPGAGRHRYRVRAQNGSGNSAWTIWKGVNVSN
jgi:subtilisin family serine protease